MQKKEKKIEKMKRKANTKCIKLQNQLYNERIINGYKQHGKKERKLIKFCIL